MIRCYWYELLDDYIFQIEGKCYALHNYEWYSVIKTKNFELMGEF